MEIYNLYFIIVTVLGLFNLPLVQSLYSGVIGAFVLWGGLFALQGVGLYTMAKKQKVEKRWLAFVPFANFLFMGKLAGECNVFGQKVKRAGLYAMLAQIVTTALCFMEMFAVTYLYTVEGAPSFDQFNNPYWSGLKGFSFSLTKYLSVSGLILPIVQMIYEIMTFIILMAVYKKYVPNNAFVLGILSLFVPLSRFIILFVIRTRELIDYEAYMRKKQEEFLRQRGYTQNPYYGNPYNAGQYTPPAQLTPPEEPFAEFGEGKKENGATDDADEFFS